MKNILKLTVPIIIIAVLAYLLIQGKSTNSELKNQLSKAQQEAEAQAQSALRQTQLAEEAAARATLEAHKARVLAQKLAECHN
ncbi:hypothetical protein [Marinoscillum furvescens]|uniref:Uncharacterized protein n=1 Tax=Marinoscillum furvescens DSM 4134 TaxID=1122208 RepID=A0A3D9L3L5_MARFU|nr:hypothetical protein [Marinoscillum furvescens]RED97961.1 hypothetical protein C7460_111102 [Marinoscillum furvescens DSM 4134]